MDKLGDMDLFVRVARNAGLAAAGREVGLSPASMSARMNALEARYGTRLLNRSTRHVSLTETGQQFNEACLRILADVSEVESQILGDQTLLSGSLRITVSSDIGRQHIAFVLAQFVEKNPEITPYLHLTDDIVNITEEGFDCAIRHGDLPDSSLVARKLASNYRILCASPHYLKQKGTPKTPQALQNHDCLTMTRGTEPLIDWYFQSPKGLESITIKAARSSNDGALIRQWALEGAGIALKSFLEVADDIKAKRLVIVLKEFMTDFIKGKSTTKNSRYTANSADLHIIYPSRQYLPRRVKAFIEALSEYFESLVGIQ
ncbi:MAG: LysR family transcriptional regulator [Thiothrix sp.]|nr:MAG: LysR family transcriptional regulator [Thiothrix sp.]